MISLTKTTELNGMRFYSSLASIYASPPVVAERSLTDTKQSIEHRRITLWRYVTAVHF